MPKRVELKDLIEQGRLAVGTELKHIGRPNRRPELSVRATVVKGGISFDGDTYPNPSTAAKKVSGKSVNGWTFWRLPNGANLSSLRET